jgi:hypothetical protein
VRRFQVKRWPRVLLFDPRVGRMFWTKLTDLVRLYEVEGGEEG